MHILCTYKWLEIPLPFSCLCKYTVHFILHLTFYLFSENVTCTIYIYTYDDSNLIVYLWSFCFVIITHVQKKKLYSFILGIHTYTHIIYVYIYICSCICLLIAPLYIFCDFLSALFFNILVRYMKIYYYGRLRNLFL